MMRLRHLLMLGVLSAGLLCTRLGAEEANMAPAPRKICLLVCDVGTIDTVAKTEEFLTRLKELNVDDVPRVGEATQAADPSLARHAGRVAFSIEINRFKRQDEEIARRNRKMERVYEELRKSILGARSNRDIVVAKNYLHSFLQPYSDFIAVIDRANTSISEVEKAIGGKSQEDVASSSVFLTVIMQDLKEESNTVQVGNTMVKKTVYTRKAVANVRDYNGNVVFAAHVIGSASFRRTSASKNVGRDPASDIMEDILKQVADKVADHFTAKLTVKAIGPKNDEEFSEDAVVLQLDGQEFENGGRTVTGAHILKATCDGYRDIVREVSLRPGKGRTLKLVFRKAPPPQPAAEKDN